MGEFWEHYLEILSNPAHLAVELTIFLLIDVLILGLAWPLFKRHCTKTAKVAAERAAKEEHKKIDTEHGLCPHD